MGFAFLLLLLRPVEGEEVGDMRCLVIREEGKEVGSVELGGGIS